MGKSEKSGRFPRDWRRWTSAQWLGRSAAICALVGIAIAAMSLRKIDRLPVSAAAVEFEAARAHAWMTTLSKKFPGRTPWSDSRRRAALWLKSEFRKLGYEPQGMTFSETIDGTNYTDLENVFAIKRGTKHPEEIIAVAGHYDITDTTTEGAMDDASGIGIILELARVLADEPTDRTILFLATDSEEFGAFWGAKKFSDQFVDADKIVAIANFDFVAPGKQTGILMLCDGLKQGYTPLWLRELALDSMRSIGGFEAIDFRNFLEFIERAILIPPADHGAFLAAGIPSFNWVGQTADFPRVMAEIHHTNNDVAEALEVESFIHFGKSAERLIRSIDGLGRIPKDFRAAHYFKISRNLYLDGPIATLLLALLFLPFLVWTGVKSIRAVRANSWEVIGKVVRNELKNAGMILGALLAGYLVIQLLPALKLITQYEIFPATQKSPILYRPDVLVMGGVLVVVIGIWQTMSRLFRHEDDQLDHLDVRLAFHAFVLAIIVLLAFPVNPFQAALLLLPPAYLWSGIRSTRDRTSRVLNLLLIAGGTLSLVIMAIVMGTIFHIGHVYWYLFLASAYGLVSAYAVIAFFAAVALMVRLVRKFVMPG